MADMHSVLADEKKTRKSLKKFMEKSKVDCVVFGYKKDGDKVKVLDESSKGLKGAAKYFTDDNIGYALLAVASRGEGDYSTLKNVLVSWVGPDTSPRLKARSSQHRVMLYNSVKDIIQKLDGEMQVLARADLTLEKVHEKILGTNYVPDSQGDETDAAKEKKARRGEMQTFAILEEDQLVDKLRVCQAGKLGYIEFGYRPQDPPGTVAVMASGPGGYREIEASFVDQAVSYYLLGLQLEDEGDYTQTKWVLITWVGVKVEPIAKAHSATHRVALYETIKSHLQLAGEFQALSREEISEKLLIDKLTLSRVGEKTEEDLRRAAQLDAEKKEKREGTGLEKTVAKKVAPNPFVNADEGKAAVLAVGDPKDETNWAVFGYTPEAPKEPSLLARGPGYLKDFRGYLKNDNLAYVVYGVIETADGDYSTVKYMLVAWVGKDVKPLHRARSAHHRVAIYQYASDLIPMHGEQQIHVPEDLSEESLRKKLIGTKILEEGDADAARKAQQRVRHGGALSDNAIHWEDAAAVEACILQIRSTTDTVEWVAFGYTSDLTKMRILGKGEGGVAQCRHHFTPDECVMVVMGAVVPDGDYSVHKNILIAWVGPDVQPLQKSRAAQNRVELYDLANRHIQMHGEIQAMSEAEISDDLVMQKLSGSKYDSAGGSEEAQAARRTRQQTGQNVEFRFRDEKDLLACTEDFRQRKLDFVVMGYEGENTDLVVLDKGQGKFANVERFLEKTALVYILLGVQCEDEGEYTQTKNILVTWVGPGVTPLKKALSSQHRVFLYQYFKRHIQLHGELQALQRAEVSEQLIIEKLTLSKARNEDFLVSSRLKDEEKKRKREEQTRLKSGGASSYSFVATSEDAPPFAESSMAAADAAFKDVGDDTTANNLAVFVYAANKKDLTVAEVLHGTIEDVKRHFDATNIAYALYGMVFADGEYSVEKHVLVTWVGQKVKPLQKARSTQHRAALYKHINKVVPLVGEFHVLEGLDSVSEDLIRKKLEGTKILEKQDAKLAQKSVDDRKKKNPKKVGAIRKGETNQFEWQDEEATKDAMKRVTEGKVDWVMVGNHPDNKNILTISKEGSGDLGAIHQLLEDGAISYFVLSKVCPDEAMSGARDSSNYNVRRNIFIAWVGPRVKPMMKARSSQHKATLYSKLKPLIQLHGELQVTERDELNEDAVFDKLGVTGWRVS